MTVTIMYSIEILYNFIKEITKRGARSPGLYYFLLVITSILWILGGLFFSGWSVNDEYD